MLPLLRAQVQSPVRELRSCKLSRVAKKKKKRERERKKEKEGSIILGLGGQIDVCQGLG